MTYQKIIFSGDSVNGKLDTIIGKNFKDTIGKRTFRGFQSRKHNIIVGTF